MEERPSNTFLRGQVWYWEDPIFGKKGESDINLGEAAVRFSRYVIIAQTTNSIVNSSVLVIPCSSTNSTPFDVTVPLSHLFHEDMSYARVRAVFPVHPRFLQRYVCTLSDEVMKRIEAEIIKLLVPSVYEVGILSTKFKDSFGIDLTDQEQIIEIKPSYDKHARMFMIECLITTKEKNDVIEWRKMKEYFDNYCLIKDIDPIVDDIEFIDTFSRIHNPIGEYNPYDCIYSIVGWDRVKYKEEECAWSNPNKDEEKENNLPVRWDDEAIKDFLVTYSQFGVDEACRKFNITKGTAYSYWSKWRDKVSNTTTCTVSPTPPKVEKVKEHTWMETYVPYRKNVQLAISKLSNMIRDTMHINLLYDKVDSYRPPTKKRMYAENFYKKLGNNIYHSLLEFLDIIQESDNSFTIPTVDQIMKDGYIATWFFLDKLWHDKKISFVKEGVNVMEKMRKHYGPDAAIDTNWKLYLKPKLAVSFNILDSELDMICEEIMTIFGRQE